MSPAAAAYLNRANIAWRNIQSGVRMRPTDILNGLQLLKTLKPLSGAGQGKDLAQIAIEAFTRLHITYTPNAGTTRPISERPARGYRHSPRIGLFVDAPDHLSGVSMTLADWHQEAQQQQVALTMHTCGQHPGGEGTVTFNPMGNYHMNAYEGLKVQMPRASDVFDYLQRMEFDAIHISTPGPMGLIGLLAAKMHGLPVAGTYHTDFPRYARALSGEASLEEAGWRLMQWFYRQMDRIAAPTETIRSDLIAHEFPAEKIRVVGRGVDHTRFSPAHRCPEWRKAHGAKQSIKLLYAGRLSREKNLETLALAFRHLIMTRPDVCLIFVGDGPFRNELQELLSDTPAHFTGVLTGRDLSRAYASSDVFVFPSKTDTYGRVVLEAQASGLPAIVSDQGGPKEVIVDQETGMVVRGMHAYNLSAAIDDLTNNPARMARYRKAAMRHASTRTRAASFREFMDLHEIPIKIPSIAAGEEKREYAI